MTHNCDASCQFDHSISASHLLHHIQRKIPTKLKYSQTSLLPSRAEYLDQGMRAMFAAQVNAGKPLLFMPNDVLEKPEWSRELGSTVYKLYLFGVLPCGSKTLVILDDIPVYFDIKVPAGVESAQFEALTRGQFNVGNISCTRTEVVRMLSMDGFQKHPVPYLRIHFNNLADRKAAFEFIKNINEINIENGRPTLVTASDDSGRNNYYINKVAREYKFNTADWNRFTKYEVVRRGDISQRCEYTFRVSIADFVALPDQRRRELTAPTSPLCKLIDFDPTMVMQWDIETHSAKPDGSPPTPDDEYTIFNICGAYFWQHSEDPLVRICAIMNDTKPREGMDIVIECDTEREVLLAHMDAMGKMSHDISSAFNGSHFDWPLYKEKLRRERLLVRLKENLSAFPLTTRGKWADTESNVAQWCFRKDKVKIDAENDQELDCVAQFAGILDTDVSPVFLKMYSRAEIPKMAGLNFYLKANKIEMKEDMPYKRMFRIYERGCLLRSVTQCHCMGVSNTPNGDASTRADCTKTNPAIKNCQCGTIVKSIDCKPRKDSPDDYTDELLDALCHPDGAPKCCCCGKKPQNARDNADVGYYCIIDCVRPQQLYVRRMIIPDKRELSTMSYVSLSDSFYRADGMKVRNLIGAYCADVGMAFSNIQKQVAPHEKTHYPGAWVFPPNRGLHSDNFINVSRRRPDGTRYTQRVRCRPITGLDFASLYPSIMMTNNLSPDRIVETQEQHDELVREGYTLYRIESFNYEVGEKKGATGNAQKTASGWTVRHRGVTAGETKIIESHIKRETHAIAGYGDVPAHAVTFVCADGPTAEQAETLAAATRANAKIVRTVAYEEVRGRDALPGESMGLFPSILKRLFDMRVPIKREFVKYEKIRELMERDGLKSTVVDVNGNAVTMSMRDVKFNIDKVNAKQKALKVLANTFYGESGNCRSSVYKILVAAGVTGCGQYNIKMVARMCEDLGYIVHYGDTDSVYLACPDELFAECDAEYEAAIAALAEEFAGVANIPEPEPGTPEAEYKRRRVAARVVWWTKQVEITMVDITKLKEAVGDMLLADNGTRYLNMAYEEVLYPTVMTGKKKYYGSDHIDTINFDKAERKHFVKGVDVVKQGQADITKDLGYSFMHESILPTNELGLMELAEARIRKYYTMDIDPSKFVLFGKYKPDKKNVPMHKFHKRMTENVARYASDPMLASLYEPPEAGDKFQYIIAKKPQAYTTRGTKIELKKGDLMEYMRVYKSNPDVEIDLDWYMKHMIVGLFARFIAFHERFQPPADRYDLTDKDQYTEYDKYCVNEASKYLNELCDSITGFDKKSAQQTGVAYRGIYNTTHKLIREKIPLRARGLFDLDIHTTDMPTTTYLINQIKADAAEYAKGSICRDEHIEAPDAPRVINLDDDDIPAPTDTPKPRAKRTRGQQYVRTAEFSAFKMSRALIGTKTQLGTSRVQIRLCDEMERRATDELFVSLRPVIGMLQSYEANVIHLVESRKSQFDAVGQYEPVDSDVAALTQFTEEEQIAMHNVSAAIRTMRSAYRIRAETQDILNEIELEKARLSNDIIEPATDLRVTAADDARAFKPIPDFQWK